MVPYVEHWKLFLDYLMTPRVLKVLCNFHLDSVFHMGQDWGIVYCGQPKSAGAEQKIGNFIVSNV